MINRIVLFRFKPGVSDESIEKTLEMPKNWKGNIKELNDIVVKRNLMDRNASNYHAVLVMSFQTAQDIDIFAEHELHKQFVDIVVGQTEDIQVFDYQ